ncbi:C10 family peptidase [bacterium]|nr:C10 family peptidase [bacterium]
MKFLLSLLSLLILSMGISFAHAVDFDDVIAAAQTQIEMNRASAEGRWSAGFAISRVVPIGGDVGKAPAYAVLLDPIGYVLVSGDSDVRPVIAYSFDSNLDPEPSPENFPLAIFLLDAQNRIAAASTRPRSVVRRNNELWRRYIEGAPSLFDEYTSATVFGPYIDTQWNQGDPYNMFCPIDPETGARCPIGCVVTAMGQIVNYWEWPPSITFDTTDSYISDATTPTIFIDAPTANMDTVDYNSDGTDPDDTTIAHLLFACGVAIHVQYQDGGSMATSPAVSTALLGHFGYLSADDIMPSSPTFYTEMVIDVMARRVPYMSMHSPDVGHGVVVDGYRESGEFHVNYGWGGVADAWYFLPESLVAGINIVDYGIVNIVPPVITHMPVENLAGDALTGGHVMLHWDAPLNITEPVIHYNIYRSTMSAPFELLGNTHGLTFLDRYP